MLSQGLARSATFRRLVEQLNGSNVIVYVEQKATRPLLGGFLQNDGVTQGGYRYLRIAFDTQGAEGRVIPILAHELQHAVEVSEDPAAVNAQTVVDLFARIGTRGECNEGRCFETRAAKDVEIAMGREFSVSSASSFPK